MRFALRSVIEAIGLLAFCLLVYAFVVIAGAVMAS